MELQPSRSCYAPVTSNKTQVQPRGGQEANNRASENPASAARVSTTACPQCGKTVRRNQKRFLCCVCQDLHHARCKFFRGDFPEIWTCPKCTVSLLPFHGQSDRHFDEDPTITSSEDESARLSDGIVDILNEKACQLRIMHLNTQSMTSTFNEFALTIKTYPLDIITLSETWLKNRRELLEYVSINGYQTEFLHRKAIKGGGVGACIQENIKYKRRKDIEDKQPNIEHLWLEIPGRNSHSKLLLGVMYRSDKILSPIQWLDCLEDLLSHITTSWEGMIVLTGDMNIDLLGNFTPTTGPLLYHAGLHFWFEASCYYAHQSDQILSNAYWPYHHKPALTGHGHWDNPL